MDASFNMGNQTALIGIGGLLGLLILWLEPRGRFSELRFCCRARSVPSLSIPNRFTANRKHFINLQVIIDKKCFISFLTDFILWSTISTREAVYNIRIINSGIIRFPRVRSNWIFLYFYRKSMIYLYYKEFYTLRKTKNVRTVKVLLILLSPWLLHLRN